MIIVKIMKIMTLNFAAVQNKKVETIALIKVTKMEGLFPPKQCVTIRPIRSIVELETNDIHYENINMVSVRV